MNILEICNYLFFVLNNNNNKIFVVNNKKKHVKFKIHFV